MDLTEKIVEKINELADNGKLEEIITNHATSCIDDIVKDYFNWNGEGRKAIKEVIHKKLELPLERIDVSRYQLMISNFISKAINETVLEHSKENILKIIEDETGIMQVKEIKLSVIISRFIESIDKSYNGDMKEQYGHLTLHIENDQKGFVWFRFDERKNIDYWQCKHNFAIHDGKIFTATYDSKPFNPFVIQTINGFEAYLFKLYTNQVTVVIDEEDVELEYYREDANY